MAATCRKAAAEVRFEGRRWAAAAVGRRALEQRRWAAGWLRGGRGGGCGGYGWNVQPGGAREVNLTLEPGLSQALLLLLLVRPVSGAPC